MSVPAIGSADFTTNLLSSSDGEVWTIFMTFDAGADVSTVILSGTGRGVLFLSENNPFPVLTHPDNASNPTRIKSWHSLSYIPITCY